MGFYRTLQAKFIQIFTQQLLASKATLQHANSTFKPRICQLLTFLDSRIYDWNGLSSILSGLKVMDIFAPQKRTRLCAKKHLQRIIDKRWIIFWLCHVLVKTTPFRCLLSLSYALFFRTLHKITDF